MLSLLAPLFLSSVVTAAPARSLWVWHTHEIIQDSTRQKQFFEFLAAPRGVSANRISVIFLAENETQEGQKKLQDFVAAAHRRSIRVDYLCGEADYALQGKHSEGLAQLEIALSYNRSAPKRSQFDGIQYDVEPYSLPDWPKPPVIDGYLSFLSEADELIKKDHSSLKLGCAIPRWFDKEDLDGLYKKVIDRVDYVAVMDYVDQSDNFVHDGANEVAYATQTGKQAWLGVETSELTDEPHATFYAKGNAAMEEAFAAATAAFAKDRGFAGIAIEHLDPYIVLRP